MLPSALRVRARGRGADENGTQLTQLMCLIGVVLQGRDREAVGEVCHGVRAKVLRNGLGSVGSADS